MKILFLHHNMPGQWKHVAQAFGKMKEHQVVFVTKPKEVEYPGVHKVEYKVARDANIFTHRYLIGTERAVLQGQEVWRVFKKLKEEEGFTPDVICAHPGWGDALFAKDIFPDTKLLNYFEFYYKAQGSDVGFDPEDPPKLDDFARIRVKNITNLLSLESADWGITPTHWQFIQHPKEYQHKISVIHDGVNTEYLKAKPDIKVNTPNGKTLTQKDEVVTYIARNFEAYRGFPTFMQAAEIIQKRRPNCHIIAVGGDDVSYGKRPPKGTTFRKMWMNRVKLDMERMHFVGTLKYDDLVKVIQLSGAHIYLTFPFVLSWSMLESMALEALVIGSRTQPVEEVIVDGHNGLLVDFYSPEEVADAVDRVFEHKDRMQDIRKAARKTIEDRYALSKLMPMQMKLITDLGEGKVPPPTADEIKKLYV